MSSSPGVDSPTVRSRHPPRWIQARRKGASGFHVRFHWHTPPYCNRTFHPEGQKVIPSTTLWRKSWISGRVGRIEPGVCRGFSDQRMVNPDGIKPVCGGCPMSGDLIPIRNSTVISQSIMGRKQSGPLVRIVWCAGGALPV